MGSVKNRTGDIMKRDKISKNKVVLSIFTKLNMFVVLASIIMSAIAIFAFAFGG
jgi:hypothetical protein